jgi:hypothetical protein
MVVGEGRSLKRGSRRRLQIHYSRWCSGAGKEATVGLEEVTGWLGLASRMKWRGTTGSSLGIFGATGSASRKDKGVFG